MPPRDRDPGSPVVPIRRPNRITEARGYHPRGRTVGEGRGAGEAPGRAPGEPAEARPTLRLVSSTGGAVTQGPPPRRRAATGERARTATRTMTRTTTQTATRTATRTAARPTPGRRRVTVRAPEPPRLADSRRRLRAATALIVVLFLVIAARLVEFQFVDGAAYAARGLSLRLQPVDLPAPRGAILDRNGAVLAGSAEARYVYADPALVKDPAAAADALSPVLGVPRSELLPRLAPHTYDDGSAVRFEYLARGVPVEMGQAVSGLGLKGIGVRRDEKRIVPGHDLAANLIGFTGRDLNGLAGLEASYDDVLRGVDGQRTFEIGQGEGEANLDQEIPGGYHSETPARPGSSLRLTIDRDLQFEVQRILGLRMAQAKATMAAAVVLDVRSGEVLAQASYPFYDAANPLASREADRGDVATGLVVEPGSVHKGVVFAACLQEHIVGPDDSVLVPPTITKGDTTFTDTHPHAVPTAMTLPGILAWSSNVGTITLADRLGAQKLYDYQRAFGLGEPTGEGLPGESGGLVQPPANWSGSSYGAVPIGHGVSVTPLQMAAVYAAIANGGVWVRPHLVQEIIAPDGTATPAKPAPTRQVISAEHAAALRTMLEAVVTANGATGRSAAVANYRVAGKTGTGRLIRDGKAVDGEVASFVGMAPADAPRYVIAVFAHTPAGNGGAVASPAFAEMMEFTLLHYAVAPTGSKPPTFRIYP